MKAYLNPCIRCSYAPPVRPKPLGRVAARRPRARLSPAPEQGDVRRRFGAVHRLLRDARLHHAGGKENVGNR